MNIWFKILSVIPLLMMTGVLCAIGVHFYKSNPDTLIKDAFGVSMIMMGVGLLFLVICIFVSITSQAAKQ